MIDLTIRPRRNTLKSGDKLTIDIAIRSTETEACTVVFRFPASAARLSPPSTTISLTAGVPLSHGSTSHEITLTAPPGLYVLKAHAVDGVADASDQALLEVTS